jgi:hypothetical protein
MAAYAEDMHVAVADLEREQHVEPPQCHRAVDVEDIHGQHRRGLRPEELAPVGVGLA